MTEIFWICLAAGIFNHLVGFAIGHWSATRPRGVIEYGARDPDDRSRIHPHRNLAMARDAADWWRIDRRVYVRRVTDWEATVD